MAMNRVYIIPTSNLPDKIGYLEVVSMNEDDILRLPHEVMSFTEFENEWNADIRGLFESKEQFIRFF